ncbi:tetratricopeptide repeat protein [Polaromonas sp. YR568]|uniref:tetratricopeptide repeat protein n=1 Tax=Polaromonas sp. YR568 TaxID=1855301 RepID=UPI003137F856
MSVTHKHSPSPALGFWDGFTRRWTAKVYLLLGMRARAMEVFQDILSLAPDDVQALNSLGYDALNTGHPAQALPYFEKVAQLVESSNAHFNVAFTCEILGRLDEAERRFRAAIALEEKMDRAWYGLGLVLVRQHRMEEAVVALKKNTQLQPMSPFGWYQLARVHVELNEPEKATTVIQHLQGFEPKVAAQLRRETGLGGPV